MRQRRRRRAAAADGARGRDRATTPWPRSARSSCRSSRASRPTAVASRLEDSRRGRADHRRRVHAPRPARWPPRPRPTRPSRAARACATSSCVRHTGQPVDWHEGRDVWWHELVEGRPGDAARDAGRLPSTRSCSPTRPARPAGPRAPCTCTAASSSRSPPRSLPGRLPARRPPALGHRHGLDHGPVAARQRARAWAARSLLYDGAPDYPDAGRLWRLAERHRIDFLGVSPTLDPRAARRGDERRRGRRPLGLRLFGSTGEPWNPEPWLWLFERVGGGTRPIINISGGTEIAACFLGARRAAAQALHARAPVARHGRWTSTTPRAGRCAARSASSSARSRGRR